MKKKLIILMGKPASGKSTWAREQEQINKSIKHLELDLVCIVNPIYYDLEGAVKGEINKYINDYNILILDFIYYNNNDILKTMNLTKDYDFEYEIHFWNEDIEQCLINDTIRKVKENREYDCHLTIKNKTLEKPSIENIKIIEHEVYKNE